MLSTDLNREIRPEFLRVLGSSAASLYLDALKREAALRPNPVTREEALALEKIMKAELIRNCWRPEKTRDIDRLLEVLAKRNSDVAEQLNRFATDWPKRISQTVVPASTLRIPSGPPCADRSSRSPRSMPRCRLGLRRHERPRLA